MSAALLVFGLTTMMARIARADEIVAAARGSGNVAFIYRLDRPTTGKGFLAIEWSDALGRVADRRRVKFALVHGAEIPFRLDLSRAVTTANVLRARLVFAGDAQSRAEDRPRRESALIFAVRPLADPWSDYHAIMWQAHGAEHCATLKQLGIDAGTVLVADKDDPARYLAESIAPFTRCGRGWYVENIATDFYSAYHRWSPDRPVNWRFTEARKAYRNDPRDVAALMRDPSLSDPTWQAAIRDRLGRIVRAYERYRPLFYNLADEPGIADLSAFWDFDFSAASLSGMRRWLKTQYGSLAALNRQWETHFADWDAVMPMTTAQAMAQKGDNFSAWADFKAWMDVAFARAIESGARAVHAADPTAAAAVEGGQIPGWGGYDYSRLAGAIDVMELYDGGGNLEIARALNPKLVTLATSSETGPREAHDLWRELLRGNRGVILWDPKNEIVAEDGSVGPRGRALAETLREIEAGLGALLLHSRRVASPVAVLYSPPSMRTQWMLDWRPKGSAWSDRDENSYYEDDSAVRASMSDFFALLQHLGLEPRVVTPERVKRRALSRDGIRVLILPRVLSLSRGEAAAIRRFVREGGTIVADGEPGLYDEHSRRWEKPALSALFNAAPSVPHRSVARGQGRAIFFDPETKAGEGETEEARASERLETLRQMLAAAGVVPIPAVTREGGETAPDIARYRWGNGGTTILALHRDLQDRPETSAADRQSVVLTLPHQAYVYDVRQRKLLAHGKSVAVTVDAVTPAILAMSATPRSLPTLSGPRRVHRGETATLRLGVSSLDASSVLHLDVIDPSGKLVAAYGGNAVLAGNRISWRVPFAFNDPPGSWQIRAWDVASGNNATWKIVVAR